MLRSTNQRIYGVSSEHVRKNLFLVGIDTVSSHTKLGLTDDDVSFSDFSDSSDFSSDWDSDMEDLENSLRKNDTGLSNNYYNNNSMNTNNNQSKLHHVHSMPVLSQNTEAAAAAAAPPNMNGYTAPTFQELPAIVQNRMKRSSSEIWVPLIEKMQQEHEKVIQQPKQEQDKKDSTTNNDVSPREYLESLLISEGLSPFTSEEKVLALADQSVPSYTAELARAAREGDLATVKELYRNGHNLQACNQFGESIVHVVCRRGWDNILSFLVNETTVSIRVRDDLNRTPLHDAAWTSRPNFKNVSIILRECPDFFFVEDTRGHTALDFVPKLCWGAWCEFIEENRPFIVSLMAPSF